MSKRLGSVDESIQDVATRITPRKVPISQAILFSKLDSDMEGVVLC